MSRLWGFLLRTKWAPWILFIWILSASLTPAHGMFGGGSTNTHVNPYSQTRVDAEIDGFPPELFPDVRVATYSRNLIIPEGISLAGYGARMTTWDWWGRLPFSTYLKASLGVRDPVRIKAFAIADLDHRQPPLLFMNLDLLAVTGPLRVAIAKKAGLLPEQLILAATHSHSAPGGFVRNITLEVGGFDAYSPIWFESLTNQAAQVARVTLDRLKPGILYTGSMAVDGVQVNRRSLKLGVHNTAKILIAKNYHGAWEGGMINFAVHGTALDHQNLMLSSDLPGAIERSIEEFLRDLNIIAGAPDAPTILFMNGAEGDVNPKVADPGQGAKIFDRIFRRTFSSLARMPIRGRSWQMRRSEVILGTPKPGNCQNPDLIHQLFGGHVVRSTFPDRTHVEVIEIGNITMATWPGEAITEIGLAFREDLVHRGRQPWFLGLANDYLLYFTTQKEFDSGGYEACYSLYGPRGSELILDTIQKLALSSLLD